MNESSNQASTRSSSVTFSFELLRNLKGGLSMKHSVVVLEDDVSIGNRIATVVRWADPNAEIKTVDKVSEAKKELKEHTDIAYIIIDLLLWPDPNGEGGDDFVEWLLAEEQLSRPSIPILILSANDDLLSRVKETIKKFKKSIPIVKRTGDFKIKVKADLHQFIEEALQLYTEDGNAKE